MGLKNVKKLWQKTSGKTSRKKFYEKLPKQVTKKKLTGFLKKSWDKNKNEKQAPVRKAWRSWAGVSTATMSLPPLPSHPFTIRVARQDLCLMGKDKQTLCHLDQGWVFKFLDDDDDCYLKARGWWSWFVWRRPDGLLSLTIATFPSAGLPASYSER